MISHTAFEKVNHAIDLKFVKEEQVRGRLQPIKIYTVNDNESYISDDASSKADAIFNELLFMEQSDQIFHS